ncbi:YraN family protein [Chitinolyticbacter meiyuanensis]|uniref:YraN family protein n=1 Tax=Chitinolyticbacter meiyuanensis TaxID=682798 RepID=UPI0011E5ACF9|nr:YraN family protein [Chitinolyticbacter meiyuanensis]
MSDRGAAAEARAAAYLQRQGLRIVERNWRCRRGEIDLIARDGNTLVFVEVRARASRSFGGAAASITATKRARIIAAAEHYLLGVRPTPPCRFDAVCIDGDALDWLKNCFDAG